MPSQKPKLLLVVDEDLINRIDDFRYENRIPSRAEAIRQLIELGLQTKLIPSLKAKILKHSIST
jgi:metal-responsive CopG/Arc/MetJ family transcriptional regulator